MKAETLINTLREQTLKNLEEAKYFKELPETELNRKASSESWSALECFEHLNRYGDFYIPEIRKRIEQTSHKSTGTFKSGFLGNYFVKSMMPKEKLNKMKTFKSMNPNNSKLDKRVLDKFIRQQEQMQELLTKAQNIDLTKTKTAISITTWIKFRLGDTFRFVIAHNMRHIVQARKALGE